MKFVFVCYASITLLVAATLAGQSIPLPDLGSIPEDLTVPPLSEGAAAPGKRVRQTTAAWQGSRAHHLLYLPTDWTADKPWPLIVEYAGNGGYKNKYGDVSDGSVEGSRLGYGATAGQGCIWLCLPYLEKKDGAWDNASLWWGDVAETQRYCLATVKDVCKKYHGDPKRVILAGFSRGSIACNYLGLQDDEIAHLWCGFICHSHYDGVKVGWPYPAADRAAALIRLKRLHSRPQFISHEGSVQETETWLRSTGIVGDWTFVPLPFRNHSDAWVLRDMPERQRLRTWLARVLQEK